MTISSTLNGYLLGLLIGMLAAAGLLSARKLELELAKGVSWTLIGFGWFMVAMAFVTRIQLFNSLEVFDWVALIFLLPTFAIGVVMLGDAINDMAVGMYHPDSS